MLWQQDLLPIKLVECDSLTGIVSAESFLFQLSWPTKTEAHSKVRFNVGATRVKVARGDSLVPLST